MPITSGFTSKKTCMGPPKQSHLEKRKKAKPAYVHALKFNKNHSKEDGRFTSGPGGSGGESGTGGKGQRSLEFESRAPKKKIKLSPEQRTMQRSLKEQSLKKVHKVKTPEEAVELILKGENVEIQDTKDVHTVLSKLGEMAIQAKKLGSKAPNFDPCRITVKGTSLFCSEKIKTKEFPHGIPRIEMPQFKSKNPVPGSPADKLPRDQWGEVDATTMFLRHMETLGVETTHNDRVLARKLKASQAEMEGAKVAALMLHPERDPKKARITVTSDGYVVDGHHTWAAAVGRDAEDGNLDNDMEMEVVTIHLPMSKVYHAAVAWTKKMGLPQAGVKKQDLFTRALKLAV